MTKRDPIARALAEKFPVVPHAQHGALRAGCRDLIGYLQDETAKLVEVVPPARTGGHHQHDHKH